VRCREGVSPSPLGWGLGPKKIFDFVYENGGFLCILGVTIYLKMSVLYAQIYMKLYILHAFWGFVFLHVNLKQKELRGNPSGTSTKLIFFKTLSTTLDATNLFWTTIYMLGLLSM